MSNILSYFGSKSSNNFIKDLINPNIPKTGINTYVEPFGGSFATYICGDLKFNNVIYNDKNRHQVNLMYCCSTPDKFIPVLEKFKETILKTNETDPIKKWNFYKSIYHKYIKNDFLDNIDFKIGDLKKASMYAFLITSSHNSIFPRGAGFNGYKKDKDKLKLDILIDKLKKNTYTNKLLSITEFLNIDFEELIKKYDSDYTYIYLDPPYYRYNEKIKDDDARRLFWYGCDNDSVFGVSSHRRLLELIKKLKSKWALSYYYFPILEELLPKDKFIWKQKEVFRSSAEGGNNHKTKNKEQEKGVELLILNYDPETGKKFSS